MVVEGVKEVEVEAAMEKAMEEARTAVVTVTVTAAAEVVVTETEEEEVVVMEVVAMEEAVVMGADLEVVGGFRHHHDLRAPIGAPDCVLRANVNLVEEARDKSVDSCHNSS